MNNLKKRMTLLIAGFLLGASGFVCPAQESIYTVLNTCAGIFKYADMYEDVRLLQLEAQNTIKIINDSWHQGSKQEIIQLAKEQDKYILLFVGRPICGRCQRTFSNFNTNPPKPVLENGYVLWYSCYDNYESDVRSYTQAFVNAGYAFPYLFVIDPYDPDVVIASSRSYETSDMMNLIQFNLTPNKNLTWYYNQAQANQLALEQDKLVLTFYGRATSHNSRTVMELIGQEPIKSILEEKYILLFIELTTPMVWPYSEEVGDPTVPPYIRITNPADWSYMWTESGLQNLETLEQLLNEAIVPNENVSSQQDNNVFIHKNSLYVSNHTNNEIIKVFSVMGQQVYAFQKKDYQVTIDASLFPKGILIISSSQGWNVKIINQ